MSTSDADAAEALARSGGEAALELPRTLTGGEVRTLRTALAEAELALSRINVKGLTRAFRAEVASARRSIDYAKPIVKAKSSNGGSGGPDAV